MLNQCNEIRAGECLNPVLKIHSKTMKSLIKTTGIAFFATIIVTLMGLQSPKRFFLLWGTLTPITTASYMWGNHDGLKALKRRIGKVSERLAIREQDTEKLSVQLEMLGAISDEISS